MQISKLHHCVYALNYHLVLVTKYRRKCLTAPMLAEFELQAKERCAAWGGRLIEANGEPDHVHLLIELRRALFLSCLSGSDVLTR